MDPKDRIIVAIDQNNVYTALDLVEDLKPYVGGFKVGMEFFTSTYAQMVTAETDSLRLALRDFFNLISDMLFWDGKWDDIPNTIAGAAKGIQPLKPKYVNVHASAGDNSIIETVKNSQATVLGVTVLTSIEEEECISIFGEKPNDTVLRFALKLFRAGAKGIICSPKELLYLRDNLSLRANIGLEKIIPGIRPTWAPPNDQKRFTTPTEAFQAGATRIVIGRPITDPPKEIGGSVNAVKLVLKEIEDMKK